MVIKTFYNTLFCCYNCNFLTQMCHYYITHIKRCQPTDISIYFSFKYKQPTYRMATQPNRRHTIRTFNQDTMPYTRSSMYAVRQYPRHTTYILQFRFNQFHSNLLEELKPIWTTWDYENLHFLPDNCLISRYLEII